MLANLLIGVAGAFVGGWVLPGLGIRPWGVIGNIISATVGAIILVFLARLLNSSNSRA